MEKMDMEGFPRESSNLDESEDLIDALVKGFQDALELKFEKARYERVVYFTCRDIEKLEKGIEFFDNNFVFETPDKEPIVFVAICGKIKKISEVDSFLWLEIEDETGSVHCKTDKLDDEIPGDSEYKSFAKKYREMYKDENKETEAWEEMEMLRTMKFDTLKIEEKYTAIQRRDFKFYEDNPHPYAIVHGKIAVKNNNNFIFVQRVWLAKCNEVAAFNEMLITVENHK